MGFIQRLAFHQPSADGSTVFLGLQRAAGDRRSGPLRPLMIDLLYTNGVLYERTGGLRHLYARLDPFGQQRDLDCSKANSGQVDLVSRLGLSPTSDAVYGKLETA